MLGPGKGITDRAYATPNLNQTGLLSSSDKSKAAVGTKLEIFQLSRIY